MQTLGRAARSRPVPPDPLGNMCGDNDGMNRVRDTKKSYVLYLTVSLPRSKQKANSGKLRFAAEEVFAPPAPFWNHDIFVARVTC